ncbi:MAG TPA: hypothetical protein VNP04_15430 [Alphaproteobacteria bacterium]|nr:hypothetical protein [Alphaproteobacteria bacterium]
MQTRMLLGLVLTIILASAALGLAQTATIEGTWEAAPNAEAHKVLKKVGSGSYSLLTTVAMPETSFRDQGNALGQVYCYQVQGTNSSGDGPLSAEQCVMPVIVPGAVGNFNLSVTIVP